MSIKTYRVTLEDTADPEHAPTREVWLAPGKDATRKGSGTAADPYRVSTPRQFDEVFREVHLRAGGPLPTAFRLMPGRYYTQGCWAHPGFATLWANDALLGSTDVVIELSDPVEETRGVRRPDVHVLSAGSPYQAGEFCRVEHVTIAGGFGDSRLPSHLFVTSGLRLYGIGSRVQEVEVDGIGGSYEPVATPSGSMPIEAFGISFDRGSGGRVKDCVVRSGTLSKRYVSAFSAAATFLDGVVFEDCVAFGNEGHAAFTVYDGAVVRNCRAHGFAYGIYNDTGMARRILVDGGNFVVNRVGIGLVAVRPEDQKHGIRVRDAWFGYNAVKEPIGIELIAKPGWDGIFQDISVSDCRFECDPNRTFTVLSTDALSAKLLGVRVVDCILPDPARLNLPAKNTVEVFGVRSWAGTYFVPKTSFEYKAGKIAGAEQ